ncbi:MAG: amidase, partial [Chloroflexota bacterium]
MLTPAEYVNYDGLGLAELVEKGEVTPGELLETAVSLIEALDPQVNAIVTQMFDEARTAVSEGLADGPFKGVPFFVKDLGEMVAGVRLTGGSRALAEFVPKQDSEFINRVRQAGFNLAGKTNTPEFGLLPTTESELLGKCHNPWALAHSPGGSSGGAGAAVATGYGPVAHATDGGGSIRIPASCCGLFGLKPTRGRTPQGPARGDSMNGLSIGNVVSRSVRDSAAFLDAVAGPDIGDPYFAPPIKRSYLEEVSVAPKKLKIALLT